MRLSSKRLFLVLTLFALYLFDIANPDALRQGTEGFYLLISEEMYEANSYLTPLIHGSHHWSKPPLHFLFPMPLVSTFFSNYLLAARLSIVVLSLCLTYMISLWYQKEFKRNWFEAFVFLTIPLYFFKYSRIFMMEMPLTLFATLASLYFFSYTRSQNNKYLYLGSIMAACSCLIKGPVSLLFIFASCGLYSLIHKGLIKKLIFFVIISTILSSLWFLLSYARYGMEFFEYFFIRENIGKFHSKNYPITSVIQGLFIYTFPIIFLLIPTGKKIVKSLKNHHETLFLVINFTFFYFIWFLPKQKSHHYAVPAIPTLSLLICYHFNELSKQSIEYWHLILRTMYHFLVFFGLFIIGLLLIAMPQIIFDANPLYLSGAFLIVALWAKDFRDKHYNLAKFILPPLLIYNFIMPLLFLPVVPQTARSIIQQDNQAVVYSDFRKPFFVEQSINRKVKPVNMFQTRPHTLKHESFVVMPEAKLWDGAPKYEIMAKWSIWRRSLKASDIYRSLKNSQLSELQERYILIRI